MQSPEKQRFWYFCEFASQGEFSEQSIVATGIIGQQSSLAETFCPNNAIDGVNPVARMYNVT